MPTRILLRGSPESFENVYDDLLIRPAPILCQTYLTSWVNPDRLTFILPTMLHLVRAHYLDGSFYRKVVGLNSIIARPCNYGRRKDVRKSQTHLISSLGNRAEVESLGTEGGATQVTGIRTPPIGASAAIDNLSVTVSSAAITGG